GKSTAPHYEGLFLFHRLVGAPEDDHTATVASDPQLLEVSLLDHAVHYLAGGGLADVLVLRDVLVGQVSGQDLPLSSYSLTVRTDLGQDCILVHQSIVSFVRMSMVLYSSW